MSTIKLRRDTAANWLAADPILSLAEPGLETDTNKIKYGDGTSHWSSLPYYATDRLTAGSKSLVLNDYGVLTLPFGSVIAEVQGNHNLIARTPYGHYPPDSELYSDWTTAIAGWSDLGPDTIVPGNYMDGIPAGYTWVLSGYFIPPESGVYTFDIDVGANTYYFIVLDGNTSTTINSPATIESDGIFSIQIIIGFGSSTAGFQQIKWKNDNSQTSYTNNFDGICVRTAIDLPNVNIYTNFGTWQFGADGVLNLPSTIGDIKRDGVSVLGGSSTGTSWNLTSQGNGCPINVTLTTTTFDVQVEKNHLFFRDDGSWDIGSYVNTNYITGDIYGGNGIALTTDRGTVFFGNSPENCGPITAASHFHIMRENNSTTELFFGDDYNYVKLPKSDNGNGVEIGTNSDHVWRFDTDGVLTMPDGNTGSDGRIAFNFEGYNWGNIRSHNRQVYIESGEGTTTTYAQIAVGLDMSLSTVENITLRTATTDAGDLYDDGTGHNPSFNTWTFGKDGTTVFPDNTIKTTTSTKITVLGTPAPNTAYAWYNIFGELNNSTSTQNTTDGSVAYDADGNVYVLGSTTDFAASHFDGTNLFIKYSPQGELLWRKTWTDPTGDPCGSYNASMRFVPLAGTATAGIVWASNGQGWTSSDRIGYVGTMDLDGNLVDLYGNARAPRAVSDYRITDIVPLEYDGFDGAYISGSWWDRAGTDDSYASIGGLDFNNNAISGTNFVFVPEYQQPGYGGAHFKSIHGVGGGLWATGSYPNTTYSGNTKTPIVGIIEAGLTPIPHLFTIGEDYIAYDMWIEDSGMDDAYNAYMLVNVYGYNHSVHSSANDYTVVLSNSLSTDLTIDRWQKNITRVGANDGRFSTLGLGLVNYGDYVYVSMYLGETGNDSDFALLKLNAATGALVWARTIGSPVNEGNWNLYSDGWNSSSDIAVDPTGAYITFSAVTQDHSTSSQYCNNFTIQYPLDGSLLGTYGDFTITDSTADFVVTDHDFVVNNITTSTTINQLSLSVSTATLTASATTVGSGWTNIRQPIGYDSPATPDQTWTFGQDGKLTLPNGAIIGSSNWVDGIPMTTERGTILFGNQPECVPTAASHFHIMKQDPTLVDLFFGDDFNYVKLPATGGIELQTFNTSTELFFSWALGTDGTMTFPDDLLDTGDQYLTIRNTNGTELLWYNNDIQGTPGEMLDTTFAVTPFASYIGNVYINNDATGTNETIWLFGNSIFGGANNILQIGSVNYENSGSLTYDSGIDIQDANGNSLIYVATTATAPDPQINGQLWFNSIDARLYIKYNDQWVDTNPSTIPNANVYLEGLIIDDTTISVVDPDAVQTINIAGNLEPTQDLAYDLGSPTNQWNSLYVNSSTIYMGGQAVSVSSNGLTVNGNPAVFEIDGGDASTWLTA